jgi:hypothetical protein
VREFDQVMVGLLLLLVVVVVVMVMVMMMMMMMMVMVMSDHGHAQTAHYTRARTLTHAHTPAVELLGHVAEPHVRLPDHVRWHVVSTHAPQLLCRLSRQVGNHTQHENTCVVNVVADMYTRPTPNLWSLGAV